MAYVLSTPRKKIACSEPMIFNGMLPVYLICFHSVLLLTILVTFSSVFSGVYIEIYASFAGNSFVICSSADVRTVYLLEYQMNSNIC